VGETFGIARFHQILPAECVERNGVRLTGMDVDLRCQKTLERVFVSTAWLLYPSLKRWVRWKT
jgi:hypothetical protein